MVQLKYNSPTNGVFYFILYISFVAHFSLCIAKLEDVSIKMNVEMATYIIIFNVN